MDDNLDVVDRQQFASARIELGGSFGKIVEYYRDDAAKAISGIEDAVRRQSAADMVRPAHTLKGDSLMLGAEALGLAAEEIEKAARQSVEMHDFPAHMLPRIGELRGLYSKTLGFFEKELAPVRMPVAMPPLRRGGFGRKAS